MQQTLSAKVGTNFAGRGGRWVGIVPLWTKGHGVFFFVCMQSELRQKLNTRRNGRTPLKHQTSLKRFRKVFSYFTTTDGQTRGFDARNSHNVTEIGLISVFCWETREIRPLGGQISLSGL
jgi:hypothetical protein